MVLLAISSSGAGGGGVPRRRLCVGDVTGNICCAIGLGCLATVELAATGCGLFVQGPVRLGCIMKVTNSALVCENFLSLFEFIGTSLAGFMSVASACCSFLARTGTVLPNN